MKDFSLSYLQLPRATEEGLGVTFKTVLNAEQGWDRGLLSCFRQRHMGTTNSAQAPSAGCNWRAGAFRAGQVGRLGLPVLRLPAASCATGRGEKGRCRRVRHPLYFAPSIKGAALPLFQALNTCQARDAPAASLITQIRTQGTSGPRNYGGGGGGQHTHSPKVPGAFRALKRLAHGRFWKHSFPGWIALRA